jgi:hypothetical protein
VTKDEYRAKVHATASTFLLEIGAEDAMREEQDYMDLMDTVDGHDVMHSLIDSVCASTWKDAVQVLEVSEQNPDNVDPGIYEECNWKKVLVILAFEVFKWDVEEEAQRMYEEKQQSDVIVQFPDTHSQLGFFPKVQDFLIPESKHTLAAHEMVRIFAPGFSVVFEGTHNKTDGGWIVHARRVYTMPDIKTPKKNGVIAETEINIEDALKTCFSRYGVKKC